MEWQARLTSFVRKIDDEAAALHAARSTKAAVARYRGAACGAQYAEAYWTSRVRPVDIL